MEARMHKTPEDDKNKVFRERLTLARRMRGLDQKAMARRVGVLLTYYRRCELGPWLPELSVLIAIADTLDVSIDWLLGRDRLLRSQSIEAAFEVLQVVFGTFQDGSVSSFFKPTRRQTRKETHDKA